MKHPIDSTKIQRTRRCKINSVEHKRWAAYATAALASSFSFSLANSAEGKIHYSGLINQELDGDSSITFPLGDEGALVFEHAKHYFGTITCTTSSCRGRQAVGQDPPGARTRVPTSSRVNRVRCVLRRTSSRETISSTLTTTLRLARARVTSTSQRGEGGSGS